MSDPDRIQSHIRVDTDGIGVVTLELMFGNGDTIACSCATDERVSVPDAIRIAIKHAYSLAALLPIEPRESDE